MTWDEAAGTIVTGAIGLGVGLAITGKLIKDITAIKSENFSGGYPEKKSFKRWRL